MWALSLSFVIIFDIRKGKEPTSSRKDTDKETPKESSKDSSSSKDTTTDSSGSNSTDAVIYDYNLVATNSNPVVEIGEKGDDERSTKRVKYNDIPVLSDGVIAKLLKISQHEISSLPSQSSTQVWIILFSSIFWK